MTKIFDQPGGKIRRDLLASFDARQISNITANSAGDLGQREAAFLPECPERSIDFHTPGYFAPHASEKSNSFCAPRFANAAMAVEHPGMSLGQEIRRRREAKPWTLQQLADEVGSDPGNISRIERDLQEVTQPLLKRIAKALDATIADLYSEPGAILQVVGKRDIKLAVAIEWLEMLSDDSLDRFKEWAKAEILRGPGETPKKRA